MFPSSYHLPSLVLCVSFLHACGGPTLEGSWSGELDCEWQESAFFGYMEGEADVELLLHERSESSFAGTLEWEEFVTGDSELFVDAEFDVEVSVVVPSGPQDLDWSSSCDSVNLTWNGTSLDNLCEIYDDQEELDVEWDGVDLLQLDGWGCEGDLLRYVRP